MPGGGGCLTQLLASIPVTFFHPQYRTRSAWGPWRLHASADPQGGQGQGQSQRNGVTLPKVHQRKPPTRLSELSLQLAVPPDPGPGKN